MSDTGHPSARAAHVAVCWERMMLDLKWRDTITSFGEQAVGLIAELEREVPPALLERILALCMAVDDHSGDTMREEMERNTARTLAHFPDIAPARWVVYAHLAHEI